MTQQHDLAWCKRLVQSYLVSAPSPPAIAYLTILFRFSRRERYHRLRTTPTVYHVIAEPKYTSACWLSSPQASRMICVYPCCKFSYRTLYFVVNLFVCKLYYICTYYIRIRLFVLGSREIQGSWWLVHIHFPYGRIQIQPYTYVQYIHRCTANVAIRAQPTRQPG